MDPQHQQQRQQSFQHHDMEQQQILQHDLAHDHQVLLDQQQQLHHHQHHHHQPQPQQHQHHHQLQQQQLTNDMTMQQIKIQEQQQQQQQLHQTFTTECATENADEVLQQLMILVRETQDTDSMVQSNRDVYQDFVIQLQTRSRLMSGISSSQYPASYNIEQLKRDLAVIENVLRQKANELNRIRRQLISSQYNIFERLMGIQSRILNHYLPRWHHEQQLMNNGVQSETIKLDTIQTWVEKIVDIIWRIKNQIKGLQLTLTDKPNVPFNTEDLENFVVYINKALENLILNAFVVEKQPPQVMKTNTRFTATVRFLCGNKLNVQMINPTVKALILSEQNARTVIRYHKQLIENSWSAFDGPWPQSLASDGSPVGMNVTSQPNAHQPGMMQTTSPSTITTTTTTTLAGAVKTGDLHAQPAMITPNAQTDQRQQAQHLAYSSSHKASPVMGDGILARMSHDQMITSTGADHSPSHQQFFQQAHHRPPPATTASAQQHFQATPSIGGDIGAGLVQRANITNMTTNQHYGSITEIGYNPDVPVNSKDFECSGEILNNSNILEFHEASGQMISHFKNMQLKKIKRTEKKGTESVMDEKFILLFFTEFRIADDSFWPYSMKTNSSSRVKRGDLLFHILAFSLPVVVIVHGNQEPHAWATVTWHNAFATPDELLYSVPDRVPWRDLGNVLSEKFRSYTKRGLSQQNLRFLASKVYRNHADNDDVLITWNQFSKEPLADKSFTFWEWFHSILKLTKDHLSPLWKADRVYGFIGKKGCVDLLLGSDFCEPATVGTFLLRFSETELGGITIAWVSNSSELSSLNPSLNDCVQISQRLSPTNSSTNVVMHLQPFVAKDLNTRPLADRIRDLKDLVFLYPNITKDEAFEAYYTPINNVQPRCGESYVKSLLVTTLAKNYPGTTNQHTETSVTPNSISQSSPEAFYQENMNEIMDATYSPYDSCTNDFNYTIH